jgi:hypothetical protein
VIDARLSMECPAQDGLDGLGASKENKRQRKDCDQSYTYVTAETEYASKHRCQETKVDRLEKWEFEKYRPRTMKDPRG